MLDVIEYIKGASVIIADMNTGRPSVFYEIGLSHAFGHKTILICDEERLPDTTHLAFDLQSHHTLLYQAWGEKPQKLYKQLVARLKPPLDWQKQPYGNPIQSSMPGARLVSGAEYERYTRLSQELLKTEQKRVALSSQLEEEKIKVAQLKSELEQAHEQHDQLRSQISGLLNQPKLSADLEQKLNNSLLNLKVIARDLSHKRDTVSYLKETLWDASLRKDVLLYEMFSAQKESAFAVMPEVILRFFQLSVLDSSDVDSPYFKVLTEVFNFNNNQYSVKLLNKQNLLNYFFLTLFQKGAMPEEWVYALLCNSRNSLINNIDNAGDKDA